MTTQRLDNVENRLDRIEAIVESNSQQIAELRSAVNSLVAIAAQHQQNFEVLVTEIRNMSIEIRGLQTENRRILDYLFGQQENGEAEN